jgi:hypothetical protein
MDTFLILLALGAAAIAVWTYARFEGLGPSDFRGALSLRSRARRGLVRRPACHHGHSDCRRESFARPFWNRAPEPRLSVSSRALGDQARAGPAPAAMSFPAPPSRIGRRPERSSTSAPARASTATTANRSRRARCRRMSSGRGRRRGSSLVPFDSRGLSPRAAGEN